jgi:putative transposase
MLSEEEFNLWGERLKLSEKARNLIARIRSSPPARRVGGGKQNVVGQYPSRKMGVTIQFESHHNELPAIYEMEHDPDVVEYYDQPCKIYLEYQTKTGRRIAHFHTPDFFVLRNDSAGWEECKTEEDAVKLQEKSPNRYLLQENGDWRCPPGERYAEEFGLYYRIRSSKDIDWNKQRNLQFLEDYLRTESGTVPDESRELILSLVSAEPGISLKDLLQKTDGSACPDDIHLLIATDEIYVNLSSAPLAEPDRVSVFSDAETAFGYSQIIQTSQHTTANGPRFVDLACDCVVEWDGKGYTILNVGETMIGLLEEGKKFREIPRNAFEELVKKGRITNVNSDSAPTQHPEVSKLFLAANKEDLQEANRRHSLVLAHLRGEPLPDNTVPERTLRRYVARYRAAESGLGCGYIGLLSRFRERGNRSRKHPEEMYTLLNDFIKNDYETLKQKRKLTVYSALLHACEERGIKPPSFKMFCLEVRKRPLYEQTLRRQGRRAAYQHKEFYLSLEQTTPRHGDRPFEICHIDHTELDVELICSSTNRPFGRPWATIMTDAFSRRFVAVYLTYDPPSYRSCMMVLRECVHRYGRFPQNIVVDGGSEFSSIYFESLLARYECVKKTRPPAKARFGAVCERLFHTLNTQFIHNLRGNTQITLNVRQVTKSVNPKNLAVWTLGKLYSWFCEFAYEVYDKNDHPALGQSPRQAFAAGMARTGLRSDRLIAYNEDFLISTLPTTRKGTAKVMPGKGVKINYIYYWHEDFRNPEIENTKIEVRYDPYDAGFAYAFIRNEWVRCSSDHFLDFHDRSEKEIEIAAAELRKRQTEHSLKSSITAKRLANLLQSMEADETLLMQRRRDLENKEIIEIINGDFASKSRTNEVTKAAAGVESIDTVEATSDPVSNSQNIEIFDEF